jgi:glutamate dehydrogenase
MSEPVKEILTDLPELMTEMGGKRLANSVRQHLRMGVPERLARRVSALTYITDALEIVRIAGETGCDTRSMAKTYFEIGQRLPIDWIRRAIDRLQVDGIWQARARGALRDRVVGAQRELAGQVFQLNGCRDSSTGIDKLTAARAERFERVRDVLAQMRESGSKDFASLTVAVNEIASLIGDSAD